MASRVRTCLTAGLGCLAGAVLAVVLFNVALRLLFDPYREMGGSMEPTLTKGDFMLARPAGQIRRGDLVVFKLKGKPVVKRVVGMPGEVVQLRGNRLFVDRRELEEDYVIFIEDIPAVRDTPEISFPPGEYYVLGDNRDDSLDSRSWGVVPRSMVVGRARLILWSSPPDARDAAHASTSDVDVRVQSSARQPRLFKWIR